MRNIGFALVLIVTGYALGASRAPAQADDDTKLVYLLREMTRAQVSQADSLKTIAASSQRCAK